MDTHMTAARWIRIEKVYHAALECAPEQRGAFIAEACQGDDGLRQEVEDLLRHGESSAADLLGRSPWESRHEPVASLAPGTRLGPYEIVELIATGGMGQVFRALDTRLGRSVAVKTSQTRFSDRFARESRAIASLNHPNICTVHDVGPDYLVMELIDGPTLADRIRQGPLPLDEALAIARQIAAALEGAHENGIVHRDLKPANIKIRPDGSVKVLDFGLAKPRAQSELTAQASTVTASGMILGTPGYMSPEQARGQQVDKRADIWAFGVVLYEMLSGSRPFEGATVADALASVLHKDPDLTRVPRRVWRLLGRCLEKDPQKRLRDLGAWEDLLDSGESPRVLPNRARMAVMAGAALAAAAAIAAWALWWKPAAPGHTTRFEIAVPENVQFDEYVAVSPDGRKIVFNATGGQSGLWLQDLNTLQWRRLEGTEGGRSPFWSPDSRFLGFAVRNQLKKIEVAGGPPQTLCTIQQPLGMGAWSKNGVIVFGGQGVGPLRRVPDTGGAPIDLTVVDAARGEAFHNFPAFLPDGKHFLYLRAGAPEVKGVYAASVDATPAGQPRERILSVASAAHYADGNLLFLRDGILLAQPFDAGKLVLRGDPVRVAEHVGVIRNYSVFSVSSGALAYRTGTNNKGSYQLSWFDRQGKLAGTLGEPNQGVTLSPDGLRAAVRDAENGANGDLWILDFTTGGRTRFTFHQSPGGSPAWSADGARIFFGAGPDSGAIFEKAANGVGAEKEWLTEPGISHSPTSISPDGRFLLYFTLHDRTKTELWVLPLEAGRKPVRLPSAELDRSRGSFSPDGRWIAYLSRESGRVEVYVRPFLASGASGPSLGESQWQVSRDGADIAMPRWRNDGKELFFMDANDVIEAVDVDGRSAFQVGTPKPLLTVPCNCGWDVTPDGKRFLVRSAQGTGGHTPITVVLNWQADLKRR